LDAPLERTVVRLEAAPVFRGSLGPAPGA